MDKKVEYQLDAITDEMSSSFSRITEKGGTVSGSTMADMAESIASIKTVPDDPDQPGDYLLVDRVSSDGAETLWEHKAEVAVTGDYNDLTNRPEIPAAANNGLLTIARNGTDIGTFGANAASDVLVNIAVPDQVSELGNDLGFQTEAEVSAAVSSASEAVSSSLLVSISSKQDILIPVSDGHIVIESGSRIYADLSGYAQEDWVSGRIENVSSSLNEEIGTKQDMLVPVESGGIVISGSSIYVDSSVYPTSDFVASALSEKQDMLVPVSGGHIVIESGSRIYADLSGYAREDWVSSSIGSVSGSLASAIDTKQDMLVPLESGGIIISGSSIFVDSSVYPTADSLSSALDGKQDNLVAGSGITISSGSHIFVNPAASDSAGMVMPDNSTVFVSGGVLSADIIPTVYSGSGTEAGMIYAAPGSSGVWAAASDLKNPYMPLYGYMRILTSNSEPVVVPDISALRNLSGAKIGDGAVVHDVGLDYRHNVTFLKISDSGGDFPDAPGWTLWDGFNIKDSIDVVHMPGMGTSSGGDTTGAFLVYNRDGEPALGSDDGTWEVTAPEDLVDGSTIVYSSGVFHAVVSSNQIHSQKIIFESIEVKNLAYNWNLSGTVTDLETMHLYRNGLLLYPGDDYTFSFSSGVVSISFARNEDVQPSDRYLAEAWYY